MSADETQAYVNWGRLVADCASPVCTDAVEVQPGQGAARCIAGHVSTVVFAAELPAVLAELAERAEERRRNWFPAGHPLAVATGQPHGQSVEELRAEHERGLAAVEDRRGQLVAALGSLGLELSADGKVMGDF